MNATLILKEGGVPSRSPNIHPSRNIYRPASMATIKETIFSLSRDQSAGPASDARADYRIQGTTSITPSIPFSR